MSREEPLPREFVTLWVPESQARRRVNLEALGHFVAALGREVDKYFPERTPDCDVDIACALLPNGRLMLDIQLQPAELVQRVVPQLRDRLSALACPPVHEQPVAFSYRKVVGEGAPRPNDGFRVPFLRWADEWRGGSLDELVLVAARRTGLWRVDDSSGVDLATGRSRLDQSPANAPGGEGVPPAGAAAESDVRRRGGLWRKAWNWLTRHLRPPRPPAVPGAPTVPGTATVPEAPTIPGDSLAPAPGVSEAAVDREPIGDLDELTAQITADADNPQLYVQRAELRHRRGELAGAIEDYTAALALAPADLEVRLARGAAYCVVGDTQRGLADFNQVLTLDPNHAMARFNRALVYLELDAYEPAVAEFSQALAHDPWNARLYLGRGRAYALLKRYPEAEQDFDMSIRLDPHADEAYVLRGALCRFTHPFPECTARAVADFTRAIEISPDQPLYYLQRAENHWAVDADAEALADCQRALELDASLPAAFALRGAVRVSLEQYEEAIGDCTRAIEGGAEGVQVYLSRAEAYQHRSQFEAALRDADLAVDLAPHMASTWKCRSMIRVRLGLLDEALADLNEALRLEPDQTVLLCHRAALQRHRGQPSLAIEDCHRALQLSPEFVPAFLIRAGCWEDLEQRNQAAADLDELVRLAPGDPQAHNERGSFWMRWDDFERARADFDIVLAKNPDDLMCRFHRGQILAALGEADAALVDLGTVIRLSPSFSAAYARRAQIWLQKGERASADADYAEAIRLDPDAADQIQIMRLVDEAHVHLEREDYDRAIQLATEAIAALPDNAPALHLRANALWYSEQYVEALADFDVLLDLVDEPAGIYAARGQVLAELGEFQEALNNLNKAIALGAERQPPRYLAFAHNGRAFAHAGAGNLEAAERDFMQSVLGWPTNAWVYYNQGRVYAMQSAPHRATVCFRLALHATGPKLTARQRERARAFLARHQSGDKA